jgi:hypothetical protein
MKKNLFESFLIWIPFAAVIAFACLLGYGLTQQSMRMAANDPQIQAADDIASSLTAGAPVNEIVPPGQTSEISVSLDTFVMIFDSTGKMLVSSAVLDGQTPTVPAGIFAYTKVNGEDSFTWQPAPGVRSAVVVKSYGGTTPGYVLVGRSISEVETREGKIMHDAAIACILGWIVMFFLIWIVVGIYKKKFAHHVSINL